MRTEDFLRGLEAKLYCENGVPRNDVRLTEEESDKVLEFSRQKTWMLYPAFLGPIRPGFVLAQHGPKGTSVHFEIKEYHLPEGETFQSYFKHCIVKENLQRTREAGITFPTDPQDQYYFY